MLSRLVLSSGMWSVLGGWGLFKGRVEMGGVGVW